jgi:hypothetical protein
LQLTGRDKDILRTLYTTLKIEQRATFSADDLYLLGLDRFYEDPVHDVGGFFARCQHGRLIEQKGQKRSIRPSNRMRFIKVFSVTEEGRKVLETEK